MDHHIGNAPRRFLLPLLLAMTALPALHAQVSCGGEGQSNCTAGDDAFYSNNNVAGCQYDLRANGSLVSNLEGNSTCVDQQRYKLSRRFGPDQSWAAWALSQQRSAIGRREQLNWITTMGTHNSYSNSDQGYTLSLGQNQVYSITDQLNAGARILELDPHAYLFAVNGGHLTVCHGSPVAQITNGATVNLSDTDACFGTAPGYARYFESVLGEIVYWMNNNPQEVLLIFIDDGGDDDYLKGHYFDFQNDIVNVLGGRVWSVFDTASVSAGHVPSIEEMQAAGKSIMLISNHYLNLDQVHTFDLTGNLVSQNTPGAFRSNNKDDASMNLLNAATYNPHGCSDGDNHSSLDRGRDSWFRLGEGRTVTDWMSAGTTQPLINSAAVVEATGCGASYVELDFLYALDQVPTSYYSDSAADNRFESGVWSWAKFDFGLNGPAMLQGGRWHSTAEINVMPVACYTVNNTAPYAARKQWFVTNKPVRWADGQAECTAELNGSLFGAPVNSYENYVLSLVPGANNIWLNHKASNLGNPYVTPNPLVFQFPQGQVPAPQSFQVIGEPNEAVLITCSSCNGLAIQLNQNLVNTAPLILALDANGAATVQVSLQGTQSLGHGPQLPRTLHLAYVDGSGAPIDIGIVALVADDTSVSLEPPSQTTIKEGTAWTPVTVTTWGLDSASGTALISELMTDAQGHPYVQPRLTDNLPPSVFQFFVAKFGPLYLSSGVHNIVGVYTPPSNDALHVRATSNTVTMTVVPEMTFAPAAVTFNYMLGDSLPASQSVTVSGANGVMTVAEYSGPKWLGISVLSGKLVLSLNSAVINAPGNPLPPGNYSLTLNVSDQTAFVSDTIQVSLNIKGVLSASVPSLTLATLANQTVTAAVTVTGSSNGVFPLTITAPSWLGWTPFTTTTPIQYTFYANPAGHNVGDHLTGSIVITSSAATNTVTIPVDFYIVNPVQFSVQGPAAATVLYDGQPLSLPASIAVVPNSQHTVDASALIYDQPGVTNARFAFESWTPGSTGPLTFTGPTGTSGKKYTANYQRQYQLTTTATPLVGGSITVAPPSADGFYTQGTHLTLTAVPADGFTLAGLSVSGAPATSPVSTTINNPLSVTGTFTPPLAGILVTFKGNVAGPVLLVNGSSYTLPAQVPMAPGQKYTLSAAAQFMDPQPGIRWNFQSLNGSAQSAVTYTAPSQGTTVALVYTEQFQILAQANPATGGSISGAGWYNSGQAVSLQANANAGFAFGSFTGTSTSAANPFGFTPAGPVTVTANFAAASGAALIATTTGQRTDGTLPGSRNVPLAIMNTTAGGIGDVQITGIDGIKIISGSGAVQSLTIFPLSVGSLVPNGTQVFTPVFNWPAAATRVSFTIHFTANAGAYSGSTTLTLNR
jgi:hypothetical protein